MFYVQARLYIPELLSESGKVMYLDVDKCILEDISLLALAKPWQTLDLRFNALRTHFQIKELAPASTAIGHFKGSTKPWHCHEPGRDAPLLYPLARLTAALSTTQLGLLVFRAWLLHWVRQILRPNPSDGARWCSAKASLHYRLKAPR